MTPVKLIRTLAAFAAALSFGAAQAQEAFPDHPVTIVVPYQAGSSPDATMRLVGQQLSEVLKQPVIIDNRPGAGGLLGGDILAKAAPDGYTVGFLSNQHLLHPYMVAKTPYDPLTAFRMVAMIGRSAQVLVVPESSPAKDLKSFIEASKAKPGRLKFGSGGIGSPAHLAGQVFAKQAGLNAVHVPYKGAPQAVTALMGDQLDYAIVTAGVAAPLVKAHKLKALAVTSAKRHAVFPDAPPLAEALPGGLVLEPWSVVAVPAKTPQAVVDQLNRAFAQVLADKRTIDYYTKLGGEITVMTPQETEAFYRGEAKRLEGWVADIELKKH